MNYWFDTYCTKKDNSNLAMINSRILHSSLSLNFESKLIKRILKKKKKILKKPQIIWNRHGHECSRIWKLSGNFTFIQCIKKVSRFYGPRYIGDDFFLGPNLVSFNRTVEWLSRSRCLGSLDEWLVTVKISHTVMTSLDLCPQGQILFLNSIFLSGP